MIQIATRIVFAAVLLLAAAFSSAGHAAEAVTVLGVVIGKSTPADVRAMVQANGGRITDEGISAFTQGPLVAARGELGLDGLEATTFVFDTGDRLVAVAMTLSKHRYDAILASLRAKYRYVRGNKPFVGDADATLRAGSDVEIRLEAPHMSFEMSAIYATDTAWKQLAEHQKRQAEARRQAQDNRL